MAKPKSGTPFSDALRSQRHSFNAKEVVSLFAKVDEGRVHTLANALTGYISENLPKAFEKRDGLSDYRTNPYVLMTSASVMNLGEANRFADFLFNTKLYMALETSFGKQIEAAFVGQYPITATHRWADAVEKVAEFAALAGLNREERARKRTSSVWREIDRSCVVGNRRYLTSIKSGPNTINDTQVQGMVRTKPRDERAHRRVAANVVSAAWLTRPASNSAGRQLPAVNIAGFSTVREIGEADRGYTV